MTLTPILILNGLLLLISIGLILSDRFLLNYGSCCITVKSEDEESEHDVEGGATLLDYFADDDDVDISSSCGGKGTCGYCKVQVPSGGGEVLPTEEIFMSRKELKNNTRLACQVKVRNDIEVFIPDYLEVVKEIVANESYDESLNWQFLLAAEPTAVEKVNHKIDDQEKENIDYLLEQNQEKGALIAILQEMNRELGFLSEPALAYLSQRRNIPLERLYWIATFYDVFKLYPPGKNKINVCMGTCCYVRGAPKHLQTIEETLGIKEGETTKDGTFSLGTVNCIGCCGQAPVIEVNGEIYGYLSRDKIRSIVDSCS